MAKQRVGKIFREAVETLQEQVWKMARPKGVETPHLLIRSQTLYPIDAKGAAGTGDVSASSFWSKSFLRIRAPVIVGVANFLESAGPSEPRRS